VVYATFNTISVILLVEEAGVIGENHRRHWQTFSCWKLLFVTIE